MTARRCRFPTVCAVDCEGTGPTRGVCDLSGGRTLPWKSSRLSVYSVEVGLRERIGAHLHLSP